MERRGRKGSSSARSVEMERAGDRQEKMAGYCSTGQSPQRAVVLMEEDLCSSCCAFVRTMCILLSFKQFCAMSFGD
jgi:hypothetical protein